MKTPLISSAGFKWELARPYVAAAILEVVGVCLARNNLKRELCILLLYINSIALLHYLHLGVEPTPSLSCSGRPMRHEQFVEWSFTTPAFIYLIGRVGNVHYTPQGCRAINRHAVADILCMMFGHAGTYACAPYKWFFHALVRRCRLTSG